MPTVRIFASVILLAAVSLLAGACAGIMTPAGREPRRFTLVVTNGTAGALEAQGCGCRRLGGLERRAGFISGIRAVEPATLILDSGNLLAGNAADQAERQDTGFLLTALRHIRTTAVNMSANDCAADADFIKKTAGQTSLLSANLRDSVTGELLFAPQLIHTVNRVRIGIFGLSAPPVSPTPVPVRVDEPTESARTTVSTLQRAGCDVIVLLSQLSETQNLGLLREVPGIHFVFGSTDAPARAEALRSGNGYAVAPGPNGTHAVVLEGLIEGRAGAFIPADQNTTHDTISPDTPVLGRFTLRLQALDSSVGTDPDIELLLEACREDRLRRELQERGLHYRDAVGAVDFSGMTETERRRAVRLMNEITYNNRRLAECSTDIQLCRDMARMITEGVRSSRSDGSIQFAVQRELQARSRAVQLDKSDLVR
jgi:2',3'-cyclic-nucleotide 2'-phosphodiesterase (5'-nucleotidase family)